MKEKSLILIGGGGHCKACIDVIECEGSFNIKGILDTKERKGEIVLGYPIIGSDDNIPYLVSQGYFFLITLGQVKTPEMRKMLFAKLKSLNASLATIISPKANLSQHAKVAEGSIIMHGVNINANASIGVNCIINSGSNVEHDVIIGKHCHISTHAVVNGNCKLGDEIFVGSGSIISNSVSICDNVTVGAGSLIFKNVNESGTFVGNPLRKL